MFEPQQYELLDFGDGRRLERFGQYVLDRPCPAAASTRPCHPQLWRSVSARFDRDDDQTGRWSPQQFSRQRWTIVHADEHGPARLQVRPTDFGHVGVFPEQAENWQWIARRTAAARRDLSVLNLFAYTGGSTLAAAAAGARVVHVDAAKNIVAWARHNAALSELSDAPIRWITEDARKFVERELRRGNRYDALILDPPSYGHGASGETWKLSRHLIPLLRQCKQLLVERPAFLLLTCHTPGYGPAELAACVTDSIFGSCQVPVAGRHLRLTTRDGQRLSSGVVARWPP